MKMKRSQFKSLIKECLKEILEENTQLSEGFHQGNNSTDIINPMDDNAMRRRHTQLMRKQLKQQSANMNSVNSKSSDDFARAAGLMQPENLNEETHTVTQMSRNPGTTTPGVRNPSDYIAAAAAQASRQYFRPDLDTPLNGGTQKPRKSQHTPQTYMQPVNHIQESSINSMTPEVLREMFDDTAKTTYVEQAQNGHTSPSHHNSGLGSMSSAGGDKFDHIVSQKSPLEIFGDEAKNWGAIAFK